VVVVLWVGVEDGIEMPVVGLVVVSVVGVVMTVVGVVVTVVVVVFRDSATTKQSNPVPAFPSLLVLKSTFIGKS